MAFKYKEVKFIQSLFWFVFRLLPGRHLPVLLLCQLRGSNELLSHTVVLRKEKLSYEFKVKSDYIDISLFFLRFSSTKKPRLLTFYVTPLLNDLTREVLRLIPSAALQIFDSQTPKLGEI